MPMFVGQSDARMAWMQGQQQQDLENRRALHEQRMRDKAQRDQAAAEAAEMAQRERMQGQAIAAQQASQSFAANRASSDAYNARNDAYSMMTDPRMAAIERRKLDDVTGRESALMNVQSGNRINEHFEGMLDNRAQQVGIDINRARLDAVSTMQKGNIDARLMALQGQNAQSLAGVNNEFAMKRDAAQSGNAINEDAWARMQNRKAALMEMEGQEQQAGVSLPKPDQDKRDALWQEYRLLEDAVDNKEISPKQGLTRMDEITRKLGQLRPTMKQVPWNQDPQTLGSIIRQPDGSTITRGPKGEPVYHAPPAGVKPEMVDPAAVMHKRAIELMKAAGINDAGEQKLSYEDALEKAYETSQVKDGAYKPKKQEQAPHDPQELFRHVQNVNQLAQQAGVPIQQFVEQLGQKNPEAASAYVAGLRMIQQAQGGPAADPRSGAVGSGPQSQGGPVPMMQPGRPGPNVDPRMLQMQGQPAQAPPQRPFVGENQRTGAPPARQAVTPQNIDVVAQQAAKGGDSEVAAALQIVKVAAAKHGGMPKRGTPDYDTVQQALALLNAKGVNPSAGAKPQQPPMRSYYPEDAGLFGH